MEAIDGIGHFITHVYHQKRPHSALVYLTPMEFQRKKLVARALRDSGVIDDIDPKTVIPIKLLRQFDIYAGHYVQFKGKKQKSIRGL